MRSSAVVAAALLTACYTPPPASPPAPADVDRWTAQRKDPAPPASWDMDVDAAIAYARAHGPATAAHRDAQAVADAQIDAAGQLTNPQLHLGRTTDDSLDGIQNRLVVAVRLFPDRPWARSAGSAAARADADVERARTAEAERDVATQIRRLYAALAFGEAARAALAKQLAVLDERKRVLAEQVARGTATALESALADEDVADIADKRAQLEIQLARSRAQLGAVMGVPPAQAWKPVWDLAQLQQVEQTFDHGALVQQALSHRPELAEAAHAVQGADARAYKERTKRVPWIDSVQVERSVRDSVQWAVSLNVTLPLFSLDGGGIAAAEAREHGAEAARRRLAESTVRDLDAAIATAQATGAHAADLAAHYKTLDDTIAALRAQAGATALADPLKLLLLEERHGRAERELLAAQLDHRLALIELAALTEGPAWR